MQNDKITTRQVFIMYILATLSPAIRLFPSICAKYGRNAGWLAPVISIIAPVIVILVLSALFSKGPHRDMTAVFEAAFGKVLCKILLAAYLLWTLLLLLLYIRHYAERLVTSLFTSAQPDFFIITMLAIVLFVSRGRVSPFARFSEFSFLIFAVVFIVFFISLLPTFKPENVLPITYYDAVPILRSSYPIVSVWGFITLFFFLGEHIDKKDEIKKHGLKAAILLSSVTAILIFVVVGSLGPDAAARMPFPFFKVSKLINIMQSFDRFEAVLASVWLIADFILIAAFVFIIMNITKRLFNMREIKYLAAPVVILGYAGSLFIAAGRYELEGFSDSYIAHSVNLALCLGIPALAAVTLRVKSRV